MTKKLSGVAGCFYYQAGLTSIGLFAIVFN